MFRVGVVGPRPFFALMHTAAEPSHDEWQAYLDAVARVLTESSGVVHAFAATDGGGPSAGQRRDLAAVMATSPRSELFTHVFTEDRLVRGMVTAFRWITRAGADAYAPREFPSICSRSGLSLQQVSGLFSEMQQAFPPLAVLTHMLRAPPRHSRQQP